MPVLGDELRSLGDDGWIERTGGHRVMDRLLDLAVVGVPAQRTPMEHRNQCRIRLLELVPEQVGEQVMESEPSPFVVEWDEKEVRALDPRQHRRRSA